MLTFSIIFIDRS